MYQKYCYDTSMFHIIVNSNIIKHRPLFDIENLRAFLNNQGIEKLMRHVLVGINIEEASKWN